MAEKKLYTEGDNVRAINAEPLEGNTVAPPVVVGEIYPVKKIHLDSGGNQHLDLGLESKFNYIKSYETKEDLPDGDTIHWCHPGRVEPA